MRGRKMERGKAKRRILTKPRNKNEYDKERLLIKIISNKMKEKIKKVI